MHGWTGKILRVNLSTSEITQIPTEHYALRFLGGRGIASRIYWETVAPETKAFDPGNCLIFMTGPLVATTVQGASRLAIVGKSPMALPETYCYGSMGGFVGPELKNAGFDGVVFDGRAPTPVYLWVNDGHAELRDASSLWGQGVYRVRDQLHETHGKNVRFIATGVAGENMVRTAVVIGDHDSSASGGWGAVMGSKNLKALAIVGTGRPTVANPDALKELNRYTAHIAKRVVRDFPPNLEGHDVVKRVGKGRCYQCGLDCLRGEYSAPNGWKGFRKCQSMEVYLPWKYDRQDEPLETLLDAPTLCNDYSMCTWEVRNIIDWLHDCYREGCLSEEETGLPLSKIGTREFFEKLLHSMAHREGFGDILAEGLVRAGERLPARARAKFTHAVAPIGQGDVYAPRAAYAHTLLYAMEPRIHMGILHEVGYLKSHWLIHTTDPAQSPVSAKVYYAAAKAFWGSEEAGNQISYEGKALAARKIQNRTYLKDSLGLCDFGWPILTSFNTPDHVGDPTLEGRLFEAVTGVAATELERCAESIFTVQRAILVQEGWPIPDAIPDYNFTEPLFEDVDPRDIISVQEMKFPAPDGEVINIKSSTIDREKYSAMLKEYYQLRGWDPETGTPDAATLASLGIEELAPSFRRVTDGQKHRQK